jgi:heme/copper-type cytochrome/quinol oxidase subunit 2
MTEDEALISIRPKQLAEGQAVPMYLSPIHSRMIFIGIVILLPVIVVAIGMVVAWRRRQRG